MNQTPMLPLLSLPKDIAIAVTVEVAGSAMVQLAARCREPWSTLSGCRSSATSPTLPLSVAPENIVDPLPSKSPIPARPVQRHYAEVHGLRDLRAVHLPHPQGHRWRHCARICHRGCPTPATDQLVGTLPIATSA